MWWTFYLDFFPLFGWISAYKYRRYLKYQVHAVTYIILVKLSQVFGETQTVYSTSHFMHIWHIASDIYYALAMILVGLLHVLNAVLHSDPQIFFSKKLNVKPPGFVWYLEIHICRPQSKFFSISLDLEKFQISCKAQTYHSGSFGPNTGYMDSNNVSKGMFVLVYGYVGL